MTTDSEAMPHYNFGRRAFIGGAVALAAVAAAVPERAPATTIAVDSLRDLKRLAGKRIDARFVTFADPELAMRTEFRMEHGLEEYRDYVWWYYFSVFGITKGKRPVELMRYEGIEMVRFQRAPGSEFRLMGHGHNVSFPIDSHNGDFVTRWTNPFTGAVVEDVPDNVLDWDPGRIYTPLGDIDVSHPERGVRPSERVFHMEDGLLLCDKTRLPPVEWPGLFLETNSIQTPVAELLTGNPSVPGTRGGGSWVNPFFGWMKMDGIDGHIVSYFRGRKVDGVGQLPQRFNDRMQQRYPQLMTVDARKFDGSWFKDPKLRTAPMTS